MSLGMTMPHERPALATANTIEIHVAAKQSLEDLSFALAEGEHAHGDIATAAGSAITVWPGADCPWFIAGPHAGEGVEVDDCLITEEARLPLLWCRPLAGPLYRVNGEDGHLHVYDWTFTAATLDGRTFEHRSHVVRGTVKTRDGYMAANYNHANAAAEFAAQVAARGSIDPAYWIETTGEVFDLEAALKEEARREQLDRLHGVKD
jgi:hypothetical protein